MRSLDPAAVETLVLLALILAAGLRARGERGGGRTAKAAGARGLARFARLLARMARLLVRRPGVGVAAAGLAAATLAALLATAVARPEPRVHDEFGYLLLADTFTRGRIANPSPPHPAAFETFHQLIAPVYAAKFPPAQGLVLAAGQVLAGRPLAGLWLSVGLAAAAVAWALVACVGPRWALFGSAIAVARLSLTYWGHSYWGGAVAAAGGALVLGALARLERRPSARDGAWFGLGLAVLANSRPYEGLVFALPAIAALIAILARGRRVEPPCGATLDGAGAAPGGATRVGAGATPECVTPEGGRPRNHGRRTFAGLFLVLVPAVAATLLYDHRVTGEALTIPYVAYERLNRGVSAFPWRAVPDTAPGGEGRVPRAWQHREIARYYLEYEYPLLAWSRTPAGFLGLRGERLARLFGFFVGIPLALACAGLAWIPPSARNRFALGWLGVFVAGLLVPIHSQMHYAAPALALAIAVEVEALRALRGRLLRPAWLRRALVASVLAALLLGGLVRFARREGYEWRLWPERRWVLERLAREPGKHLVFVRYGPRHDFHDEWVFNAADLATAPVVWARSTDPELDAAVRSDWPDRRTWVLDADATPPRLLPFADTLVAPAADGLRGR